MFADVGGVFLGFSERLKISKGFAGFKGFAVFWSEAVAVDSFDVSGGAVADVLIETVVGVFGGDLNHIAVASYFGNDGSGGNFADFGVGLDDGRGIGFEWGVFEEINFTVDDDLGERSAF